MLALSTAIIDRAKRSPMEPGRLAVWLSASPTQIRELWKNVVALVNEELPTLQRQVLTTPASPEEDA